MGREARRVPADWEHPRKANGLYQPLYGGSYAERAAKWDEERAKWDAGIRPDYWRGFVGTYAEWAGDRPAESDYMPDWPESERTHLQMYENTSEGTPISPVMETPEALARWLADTGASAFGSMTAPYDHWLSVCNGGWAPSAAIVDGMLTSGVSAVADVEK